MFLSLFRRQKLFVSGIGFEIETTDLKGNVLLRSTLFSKEGLLFFDKSQTIDFSPIELFDFNTYKTTKDASKEEVILKKLSQDIYNKISSYNGEVLININLFNFNSKIINAKKLDKFEVVFLIEDLENIFQESFNYTLIKEVYLEDKIILSNEHLKKKDIIKNYKIVIDVTDKDIEIVSFLKS